MNTLVATPQASIFAGSSLPVRKSVRRLRWFIAAFEHQVEAIAAETGNTFEIDRKALPATFVEWLRAFEAQKPANATDRLPYVGFAAGLMLRTLVRHKPLRATAMPTGCDLSNPAYYWPEGYVYVAFCLNVRAMVLEQDFHETQALVPALSEARTWWSFRENVADDTNLAIAFLDLFAGEEPNWAMPDKFQPGKVKLIANRFYRQIEKGAPPAN
ncbi:MAG: hypothetical protein AcusKO_23460 [Acuticoccus sp.]